VSVEERSNNGSGPTKGDLVIALVRAAHERKSALEQVGTIQRAASEHHAAERARAKQIHHDANRALVQAVDAARAANIQLKAIAERCGLSTQSIIQLRRSVAEWDAQRGEEEVEND
jgi:hypothetical protein